ncbi:uncharacterized serine/threonine-protein kinase SBK3 [Sarcophilus harrisii]|uniref:uncharacterized serine/threonine-protein kinase SBK3 n=1 Tax=Sarcophilus harrisii TaxID=9305 RepID=UPI00130206F1|nr:uncharacterized serine/threonine-protein kinase SBK3 [Sarcophilus harrisii]
MENGDQESPEDGDLEEEDSSGSASSEFDLTARRVTTVPSLRSCYRLVRELGAGTYGRVLLARPRRGGPPIALKLLPRTSASRATFLREFCIGVSSRTRAVAPKPCRAPALAFLGGSHQMQPSSPSDVGEAEGWGSAGEPWRLRAERAQGKFTLTEAEWRFGAPSGAGLGLAKKWAALRPPPDSGRSGGLSCPGLGLQSPTISQFCLSPSWPCLAAEPALPELQLKRVGVQLAGALDFLHARGLVHADVKPDNVLVFDRACRRVALGDFGLTRPEGCPMPAPPGPLPSAPPELCLLRPPAALGLRPELDSWGLGVLLFCASTAAFPWAVALAPDPGFETFAAWQTARPQPALPPPPWARFSAAAQTLLRGLLALEPEKRSPPTAVLDWVGEAWMVGEGEGEGGGEEGGEAREEEEGARGEEEASLDEEEEEEEEAGLGTGP